MMISGRYIILLFITISTFSWGQDITVEEIWKEYTFFGSSVDGFRSMQDGNYFSKISKTGVTKHSFTDTEGSGEVLIPASALSKIRMDDYAFNSDETKALITTGTESIYRRSYSAVYYLYDLKTKQMQALDNLRSPQTLAEYSPDGTKVSYIFKNNLYIKDIASGKVKQLTKDGKRNGVINGTTDWVYEEEFSLTKGYAWSPDSKYIAFLRFDESEVREFTLTYFNELYPDQYTFKYPKAGERNSCVTAYMIKAKGGKATRIDLGKYEYIPRLKWSGTSNQLIVQTMNRHQSSLKYHLVDMTSKKMAVSTFFEEKSSTYIDVDDNLLILKDGKSILRTSESNGYNHIYLLGFDGKSTQITTGNWDVIEFMGIDEDANMIYYSSAEKGAIHKGIYKIGLDGSKKSSLSSEEGNNGAKFSNGMKYFIKTYSNANTPPVFSLCDNTGKEISILEDNAKLNETLTNYTISKKEFVLFKGHSEELNGWMIKPPNFDPSKKYPVYVNIYCGPGHNTVSDSWDGGGFAYHQLLAQKGYIVVSVDPRGTMYRGAEFKKSTYLELGKLETEDLIAVAKELQSYDYVAKDRIGIMGWSYGGFMTSLAMTKGADYFKMGIAVAPVTNWRYYDNIYTERFMRTPAENENGYDQNSPINFVDQLKGKYLLIHGSGDDNVHYQNTMEMINAMVSANKQFDLFIYPNKNHGIYGGNTRNHLYNMMLDYTLKNL
ncbi:MAG: S9 family peptidase [Crocinitomicaceae bacterium]|nr:S9 family peptidase [Flavobacteriales bacterium]NQZ36512.1 S9 family peptidase [Crocinitomicaceae bacterium]